MTEKEKNPASLAAAVSKADAGDSVRSAIPVFGAHETRKKNGIRQGLDRQAFNWRNGHYEEPTLNFNFKIG